MLREIKKELVHHFPFTAIGALTGIILMIVFKDMPEKTAHSLFSVFHPGHVFLSALVTSAMYRNYKCRVDKKECNIFALLLIGYVGSVGIATLSDSLIPYFGEAILNMPHRHMHIGFLESWWVVNPIAVIGIIIAYYKPYTKFPHFGHVLLSTWASVFHIMAAKGEGMSLLIYAGAFLFLLLAVWLPCCISDIVFPLLFVGKKER
ncbi:MAG: hypothetical protein ABII88_09085 [Candidatus Omnitrophota bacterium]